MHTRTHATGKTGQGTQPRRPERPTVAVAATLGSNCKAHNSTGPDGGGLMTGFRLLLFLCVGGGVIRFPRLVCSVRVGGYDGISLVIVCVGVGYRL